VSILARGYFTSGICSAIQYRNVTASTLPVAVKTMAVGKAITG
jgi:hypothetical protein